MSIVFGLYQANSGSIKINGKEINLRSPRDSIVNGIGMVHQHFMLVENFTVLENIILGFEGETVFGEKLQKAKEDLEKLCQTYNFNIDLDAIFSEAINSIPLDWRSFSASNKSNIVLSIFIT